MNSKVTTLINKGFHQDCLEDALIFLEDAFKLHKQEQEPQTKLNINIGVINLEILSPSNLAVKELKKEVL